MRSPSNLSEEMDTMAKNLQKQQRQREEAPPQWALQILQRLDRLERAIQPVVTSSTSKDNSNPQTKAPPTPLNDSTQEPLNQSHSQQFNKPGKALPPLQEYYGEPGKLDAWLQQAQVKIQVDYSNYSEYVKFWALSACLRGKALKRMDAWIREYGTEDQATVGIFFNQMRFVFQDPQAKERAQRKLESLRQGNRSSLDPYMEWQGLIIEAGDASLPDSAKKISLDRVLGDELARAMVTVPSSNTDFDSYCNTLKEVDDRLRAYKFRITQKPESDSKHKVSQQPSQSNWRASPQGDSKMDWTPTGSAQIAVGKQAKWVTPKELQRRKEQGLCIRCGASGHRITQCPYQPAKRPSRTMKVTQIQASPQLEEGGGISDSEN